MTRNGFYGLEKAPGSSEGPRGTTRGHGLCPLAGAGLFNVTGAGTSSSVTGGLGWCPHRLLGRRHRGQNLIPLPNTRPLGKSAAWPLSTPNVRWRNTGAFSKSLVCYFRKATHKQLPHVDVVCGTLQLSQSMSYCRYISYKTASLESWRWR